MASHGIANIRVNHVEFGWTDDTGRTQLACRGTCGGQTTGRVAVRDVVTGKNRSEAWCLSCALADALSRGTDLG